MHLAESRGLLFFLIDKHPPNCQARTPNSLPDIVQADLGFIPTVTDLGGFWQDQNSFGDLLLSLAVLIVVPWYSLCFCEIIN